MVDKADIKVGETYRTSVAIWTVKHISPNKMVSVRRDDGLTTHFPLASFASWVTEHLDFSEAAFQRDLAAAKASMHVADLTALADKWGARGAVFYDMIKPIKVSSR